MSIKFYLLRVLHDGAAYVNHQWTSARKWQKCEPNQEREPIKNQSGIQKISMFYLSSISYSVFTNKPTQFLCIKLETGLHLKMNRWSSLVQIEFETYNVAISFNFCFSFSRMKFIVIALSILTLKNIESSLIGIFVARRPFFFLKKRYETAKN